MVLVGVIWYVESGNMVAFIVDVAAWRCSFCPQFGWRLLPRMQEES
jgi:hypothetical protein